MGCKMKAEFLDSLLGLVEFKRDGIKLGDNQILGMESAAYSVVSVPEFSWKGVWVSPKGLSALSVFQKDDELEIGPCDSGIEIRSIGGTRRRRVVLNSLDTFWEGISVNIPDNTYKLDSEEFEAAVKWCRAGLLSLNQVPDYVGALVFVPSELRFYQTDGVRLNRFSVRVSSSCVDSEDVDSILIPPDLVVRLVNSTTVDSWGYSKDGILSFRGEPGREVIHCISTISGEPPLDSVKQILDQEFSKPFIIPLDIMRVVEKFGALLNEFGIEVGDRDGKTVVGGSCEAFSVEIEDAEVSCGLTRRVRVIPSRLAGMESAEAFTNDAAEILYWNDRGLIDDTLTKEFVVALVPVGEEE